MRNSRKRKAESNRSKSRLAQLQIKTSDLLLLRDVQNESQKKIKPIFKINNYIVEMLS